MSEIEFPPLPQSTAWNCQLVMNGSEGVVEGWFTTKAEDEPDDIPNGWDARIERAPVFTAGQLRAYAAEYARQAVLTERERCAKVCEEVERLQDNDNGAANTGGAAACAAAIRAG